MECVAPKDPHSNSAAYRLHWTLGGGLSSFSHSTTGFPVPVVGLEARLALGALGPGGRSLSTAAASVSCQLGMQRISPTVKFLAFSGGCKLRGFRRYRTFIGFYQGIGVFLWWDGWWHFIKEISRRRREVDFILRFNGRQYLVPFESFCWGHGSVYRGNGVPALIGVFEARNAFGCLQTNEGKVWLARCYEGVGMTMLPFKWLGIVAVEEDVQHLVWTAHPPGGRPISASSTPHSLRLQSVDT
jgi:hypothetical protein